VGASLPPLWGNLDTSWGRNDKHISAPTDKGYIAIYSNMSAFDNDLIDLFLTA
jgi:hypothetical protein